MPLLMLPSTSDDSWAQDARWRIESWQLVLVALVCIATALWVFWGALEMGYHLDDFVHLAEVEGTGVMPSHGPLELFTFAEAIPDRMGKVQGDYLPWWRAENIHIRFFRPLASLTYYIDYWLWGDDAKAFHASSLVWYCALIAGCVALYGLLARLSGRGVFTVLLAGLIFATAREHEGSAAWLAGRYTMVGAVFSVPALLMYHRWREEKRAKHLVWTLVLFATALLSSEAPVALSGFFFAYEISFARDRVRDRVLGILPVALLAIAWLAYYVAAGYGTEHSDWYIDPITHPGKFVDVGLREKLPLNMVNLFLPAYFEPEFIRYSLMDLAKHFAVMARLRDWLLGLGDRAPEAVAAFHNLAILTLLAAFGLQSVKDRAMRFALVGTVLSLVPLSAAPTPQRVLLIPTIGMSWIFASFIAASFGCFLRPRSLVLPWNPVRIVLAAILLYGLYFEWQGVQFRLERRADLARGLLERAHQIELPAGENLEGLRVLLVTSPTGMEALYTPLIRVQQGYGWPEGIWGISAVSGTHTLTRTGDRSFRLELDPAHPTGFLDYDWASLFRDDFDMYEGRAFKSGVLHVRIGKREEETGRVFALDVEIDKPLDDPDVWLMTWEDQQWRRRAAPALGEKIDIPTVHAIWVPHE